MTTNPQSAGILVVEDDPSIAAVLEEILTGKDYSVRVATNPTEAIEAVGLQLPELVLMDINLSSDIDGIETVRRLRVDHEDLPVCFITAFSDDETVHRAEAVAPMAYLVKPFEMADVLTMVNISLAGARRSKDRPKKKMMLMAERRFASAPVGASQGPGTTPEARPAPPEVLDDRLTGLPNRLEAEREIDEWDDNTDRFVAVLSVDHLPLLRQRFGGTAIDQILFTYSQHIGQHLPDRYVLARWDASTFVVTPKVGGTEAQREVARAVAAPMLYHLRLPGRSALLRVSATMRIVYPKGKPLA
jgi:CheY-like chemotaxis protein